MSFACRALGPALLLGLGTAASADTTQLVAAPDRLALVHDGRVSIYDGQGDLLATLPAPLSDEPLVDGTRRPLAVERALDALDVPESERDDDHARDLLDDELPRAALTPPPPGTTSAPTPGAALASSDGQGIIVLAEGSFFRFEAGHAARRLGPAPPSVRALATGGGRLFVARPGEILATAEGSPPHDLRFAPLVRPPPGPLALAVDPAGAFLVVSSGARVDVVPVDEPAQGVSWQAPATVHDTTICEGRAVALVGDALWAFARGGWRRLASAAGQHRVSCPADRPGPWWLHAPGLVRADDGASVPAVSLSTPGPIAAAASIGARTFVFGPGLGLLALSAPTNAEPRLEPLALTALPAPAARMSLALRAPAPVQALRSLLPYLSVLAETGARRRIDADSVGAGRRDLRLALVAEWRVGGTPSLARLPLVPTAFGGADGAADTPVAHALGRDPEASCLVRARLRAVGLALAEPDRARSLVTRAGRAAWLPELRLRAERRVGRSESLDVKPTATSDALGLDTADDVRYEIRATWDLPRLVFSAEELGAAQQAFRIADMRREIESQVNRLYYERRRLLAAPGSQPAPEDLATWQLRIEEIEADLDALSGGDFSRCRQGGPPRRTDD